MQLIFASIGNRKDVISSIESLEHFKLNTRLPEKLNNPESKELMLKKLAYDKKFQAGKIKFVLLEGLGRPILSDQISVADIEQAIKHISL